MHINRVILKGFLQALWSNSAVCADVSCYEYISDVFMVLREHEVCFSSAGCVFLPAVCLCIVLGFVVLLFHLGLSVFCCVCWMWVWYGLPVFGSYLDAVASALMACFLAWAEFLASGMLCRAPSAYAAPVPKA